MNDEYESPGATDHPEDGQLVEPEAASESGEGNGLPPWLVPLLIGLVTITAGVFAWRAGQLASSAAYQDRQAVGQTIKQEQQRVASGLETVNEAVSYVGYAADFAEAAAMDSVASELDSQGLTAAAATVASDADVLRRSATELAQAVGVFGEQSVLTQSVIDPDQPIPFSIDEQLKGNEAQLSTGITSPGVLDPDSWADAATDTRERVRTLRWQTLLLLISVLAYTVAELAPLRRTRSTGFVVGTALYIFVTIATFLGSF